MNAGASIPVFRRDLQHVAASHASRAEALDLKQQKAEGKAVFKQNRVHKTATLGTKSTSVPKSCNTAGLKLQSSAAWPISPQPMGNTTGPSSGDVQGYLHGLWKGSGRVTGYLHFPARKGPSGTLPRSRQTALAVSILAMQGSLPRMLGLCVPWWWQRHGHSSRL